MALFSEAPQGTPDVRVPTAAGGHQEIQVEAPHRHILLGALPAPTGGLCDSDMARAAGQANAQVLQNNEERRGDVERRHEILEESLLQTRRKVLGHSELRYEQPLSHGEVGQDHHQDHRILGVAHERPDR